MAGGNKRGSAQKTKDKKKQQAEGLSTILY